MIYFLIFAVCIFAELSPKIDTDNFIKKIGIGFILVGALIGMAGRFSPFIEIGIVFYFVANIFNIYLLEDIKERRRID